MKRWFLETNTLVYAMNMQGGVRERVNKAALTGQLLTSTIAVSELLYGVEMSAKREENRREVYKTISHLTVLPFDLASGERFAQLRAHFERTGLRRPRMDLMLAAQAVTADATLVTHDADLLAHAVPGLTVEDWYKEAK